MRNIFKTALLAATGMLLCSVAPAQASTSPVLRAKVPFSFEVNGRTLPAGQYTIQRDDMDPAILLIRSDKGGRAATFVSTIPDTGRDPAGSKPVLSFTRDENQYRLTGIWEDNYDGWDVVGR